MKHKFLPLTICKLDLSKVFGVILKGGKSSLNTTLGLKIVAFLKWAKKWHFILLEQFFLTEIFAQNTLIWDLIFNYRNFFNMNDSFEVSSVASVIFSKSQHGFIIFKKSISRGKNFYIKLNAQNYCTEMKI
jgi:hypothetical protein